MSTRTSHPIILRDLAQLGEYFDHDGIAEEDGSAETAARPAHDATPEVVVATASAPDALGASQLLELLTRAGTDLARLVRQDQEARQAARSMLDRYEGQFAQIQEAEDVLARAEHLRQEAATLAEDAFAEDARAEATNVAALAASAADAATRLLEERRAELAAAAAEPALARLLMERRCEEERRNAKAAEAERARRLQEGLAATRAVLAAGRLPEAEAMLGPLAKEHPDSADVTSLQDSIRRRAQAVKASVADEALRDARRVYRHAPAEAVARLERLDLRDLPPDLLRQVKGVWAAACARLCQARGVSAPLFRYLPAPAHGLVVAREQEGCYRVVSALGARDWSSGSPVPEPFLRQARPLRASGH